MTTKPTTTPTTKPKVIGRVKVRGHMLLRMITALTARDDPEDTIELEFTPTGLYVSLGDPRLKWKTSVTATAGAIPATGWNRGSIRFAAGTHKLTAWLKTHTPTRGDGRAILTLEEPADESSLAQMTITGADSGTALRTRCVLKPTEDPPGSPNRRTGTGNDEGLRMPTRTLGRMIEDGLRTTDTIDSSETTQHIRFMKSTAAGVNAEDGDPEAELTVVGTSAYYVSRRRLENPGKFDAVYIPVEAAKVLAAIAATDDTGIDTETVLTPTSMSIAVPDDEPAVGAEPLAVRIQWNDDEREAGFPKIDGLREKVRESEGFGIDIDAGRLYGFTACAMAIADNERSKYNSTAAVEFNLRSGRVTAADDELRMQVNKSDDPDAPGGDAEGRRYSLRRLASALAAWPTDPRSPAKTLNMRLTPDRGMMTITEGSTEIGLRALAM